MIIKNFKDTSGNWHDRCIVEPCDIDSACPGPYEKYKDKVNQAIPLGTPLNPDGMGYVRPDPDNDMVNVCIGILRTRFYKLKDEFFKQKENGRKINAIGPDNRYYFNAGPLEVPNVAVQEDTQRQELHEWKALLSTRRIVAMTGATLYEGPEFKFRSNLHPSPSADAIDALAKYYTMNIIIPNALLAMHLLGRKSGGIWGKECFPHALHYCMTTGKSSKSIEAWNEYMKTITVKSVIKLWKKYVTNMDENGNPIPSDRQWYFRKFVDLRCKGNSSKFRKSKNQDELQKLLERMKSEPELKTATHRRLVELGLSDTLARQFMKARKL